VRSLALLLPAIACVSLVGCGEDSPSIAGLQAEVRRHPDSVEAVLALADAYADNQAHHDAYIQYSRARELEPASFEATLGVARASYDLRDYTRALSAVEEALALTPDAPEALNLHGKLLLATEKPERAAEQFERVLATDPDNREALTFLPLAYLRDERLEEAERAARQAVRRLPDDVEARVGLATVLVRRDKTLGAEEHLGRAVELDPDNPAPKLRLAELLVHEERRLQDALKLAEEAESLDPAEGRAAAVAAMALRKLGRDAEATLRLHDAAVAYPRNIQLWLMLASLYREMGDEEAAARAASMALRFAPRRRRAGAGEVTPDPADELPATEQAEAGPADSGSEPAQDEAAGGEGEGETAVEAGPPE